MQAREALSRRGIDYESVLVDATPVPRAAALALVGQARRFLVKVGPDTLRFDVAVNPISRAQAEAYLVHEDGFLRVPVLVLGDLIIRGYTEELYREALGASSEGGPPA